MKRSHALLISLLLAFAVLAGSFAALRTTRLSTQSTAAPRTVAAAQIARQNRVLARAEAALRAELRRKPPALPAVAPARPAAAPPATVVYRRPPAVVHVIHRHGEPEDGGEHDGGGGGDD